MEPAEAANIFAECLTVTRARNINWTLSMFEDYDVKDEVQADTTTVRLYKDGDPKKSVDLEADKESALAYADQMASGLEFGGTKSGPWYV
jgi:hypothetical protein